VISIFQRLQVFPGTYLVVGRSSIMRYSEKNLSKIQSELRTSVKEHTIPAVDRAIGLECALASAINIAYVSSVASL
jgi:hypothetical protein